MKLALLASQDVGQTWLGRGKPVVNGKPDNRTLSQRVEEACPFREVAHVPDWPGPGGLAACLGCGLYLTPEIYR